MHKLSSWKGQSTVLLWHLVPFYCRYQAGRHQSGNNITAILVAVKNVGIVFDCLHFVGNECD